MKNFQLGSACRTCGSYKKLLSELEMKVHFEDLVLKRRNTRSVRKVSDRILLCEHLMDYNLARLHEPTLNLSAHA